MAGRRLKGLTLVELLLASALLAVVAVPILGALARGVTLAAEIDRRTRATLLAQQRMENILAAAAVNFGQDFTRNSEALGSGSFVTVQQTPKTVYSKTITVRVGWDADRDGVLETAEALATLGTVIVNPGS